MKNNMIKPVIHTVLAARRRRTPAPAAPSARLQGAAMASRPRPSATRRRAAGRRQAARLPADWWTVFNDATLNSLEQRALRDNPNVRAAAQRLVQAQAQLGVVPAPASCRSERAGRHLEFAHLGRDLAGPGAGPVRSKGNNYSVGAGFSWELDLWGRVRRIVEAADAQALVAQDDRDGVLLLLSSQVATTYWQLRGLDAELAILRALATRRESRN
jgi:multidrug efflux system outer membrane protein